MMVKMIQDLEKRNGGTDQEDTRNIEQRTRRFLRKSRDE